MKKKYKMLLFLVLMMAPMLVMAESYEFSEGIPLFFALLIEAFVTIHMSLFVLLPLSKLWFQDNSKKAFWTMFVLRIGILLFFDLFITTGIVIVDFMLVFVGAFLVVPISAGIKGVSFLSKKGNRASRTVSVGITEKFVKCSKCGKIIEKTNNYCTNCGAILREKVPSLRVDVSPVVEFDATYSASEKTILKKMIASEVEYRGEKARFVTTLELNKKKAIVFLIFGLLSFVHVLLFFFNYSIKLSIVLEILVLLVSVFFLNKFTVVNSIVKRAIKNPDMEIDALVEEVMSKKRTILLPDSLKMIILLTIAVVVPTLLFASPKVIYTRYGDGYQVFKYTRGIRYEESVIIPNTYKGKKVLAVGMDAFRNSKVKNVTLPDTIQIIKAKAFYNCKNIERFEVPRDVTVIRGEAFSNMSSLRAINLPEGLKEIRGGAFAYNEKLKEISLPSTLTYLGGSAFSHCSLITELSVPRGVTEINGNTFEYMTSLKTIHLHDDITMIHGETFVGDIMLDNVVLPKNITEIRGNTFENCKSLSSIYIPEGVTRIGGHAFYGCSKLSYAYVPESVLEIGSSAFRQCSMLRNITISRQAVVNERAFKESPTVISYYEN